MGIHNSSNQENAHLSLDSDMKSLFLDIGDSPEQVTLARKMKELLARYQDNEDAINYGMYLKGSDLNIDEAIDRHPLILDFLKQARENSATLEHSLEQMRQVFS
jgi:flagellum-specific ATP synthase